MRQKITASPDVALSLLMEGEFDSQNVKDREFAKRLASGYVNDTDVVIQEYETDEMD